MEDYQADEPSAKLNNQYLLDSRQKTYLEIEWWYLFKLNIFSK